MQGFEFRSARSVEEALRFLAEKGDLTRLIAGGTDLIPQMRAGTCRPAFVLNILDIEKLRELYEADAILHIGATVTHTRLIESSVVRSCCPVFVDAAKAIAGPPVRNRGTIGGNLANASPAADCAPALLVLDARVVLMSARGTRTLPLEDFFTGPGTTRREPDELLVEIVVPLPAGPAVFLKLGRRKAMSLSVVSAAVGLEMEGQTCRKARIALGSLAPTPIRCNAAEKLLEGREIDAKLIMESSREAIAAGQPIDDQRATAWYRREAGTVLVRRALAAAAGLPV